MRQNFVIAKSLRQSFKVFALIAIFILLIAIFWRVAVVGVDYHHQGLVFAAALRLAHGQTLYKDAFSQYGPMPTYVQAGAILLFGEKITSLITTSIILQASSALLMYQVWKQDLSKNVARFSILLWICTAYYLRPEYSFFPWWGDFSLFFLCLLIVTLRKQEILVSRNENSRILQVITAISIFAILLTRAHIGILLLAILLLRYRRNSHLRQLIIEPGVLIVLATSCLWALIDKPVRSSYVYQTVLWPFRWIGDVIPGSPPPDRIVYAALILGCTPIAVLYAAKSAILGIVQRKDVHKALASILVVIVLWRLKGMISTTYWGPPRDEKLSVAFFNSEGIIWSITIVFLLKNIFATKTRGFKIENFSLNEVLACVLLSEIYPVPDHAHLWMCILPLLGPTIAHLLNQVKRKTGTYLLVGLSLFLTINMTTAAFRKIVDQSYLKSSNEFTQGMYEARLPYEIRTQLFKQIEQLGANKEILNICQDGMYDAFGSRWRGPDAYQIFWGPGADGSYFPSSPLDKKREEWIALKRPLIIYCGENINVVDKIRKLHYTQRYFTNAEGMDNLGGVLAIRLFTPSNHQ